jgi:hypothetical protein
MSRTASVAVTTLSLTSVPPDRDSAGSTILAVATTSSVTDVLDGDSTGTGMVFLL